MPKICYVPKRFSLSSALVIERTNAIIEEYAAQGYDMTLRQIFYQHVGRGWIENTEREYKRLGSIINDGRLAGLIDWEAIVDRTRGLRGNSHWSSPADIVGACAQQFEYDKWEDQPRRLEVWVEKDALRGVFSGVCRGLDIPVFSCRGYTSQSEMWVAAQRLRSIEAQGQKWTILHFGDHDPSGIDMTRDITDRLALFLGHGVVVQRKALNMDQVEHYEPPPNPAKLSDSRCANYIEEYGDESWELDALEPSVLADLVRAAAKDTLDQDLWDAAVAREDEARALLSTVAEQWGDITKDLR